MRVKKNLSYRDFKSVPVNKPRSSVINGAEMVTRHSKEYAEGWERIFGGDRKSTGLLVEDGEARIPEGRARRYVPRADANHRFDVD